MNFARRIFPPAALAALSMQACDGCKSNPQQATSRNALRLPLPAQITAFAFEVLASPISFSNPIARLNG